MNKSTILTLIFFIATILSVIAIRIGINMLNVGLIVSSAILFVIFLIITVGCWVDGGKLK